jgi:hypothetical protein
MEYREDVWKSFLQALVPGKHPKTKDNPRKKEQRHASKTKTV